ncbi:hypothetical protein VP1G_00225 [Cytospora mali]|uniref:C6 zinc finger domain protein n=1 Tax=Cytospora mali TaxID=578113 RepID=A0A194UM15_CYTMA|nr:hypothetical protein VP1G_00225 [Valsa mali var. pyri (nom. inval.)]
MAPDHHNYHRHTSLRNANAQANSPPSPTPTATSSTAGDQLTKRARKSRPKVKTGCNQCNARPYGELRIAPRPSLGEARPPIAPQAIQPGQLIHFPSRRATKYQRHNTPPQTPVIQQSSLTFYRPSNIPFVGQEIHYFHLFQSHTADELSGYFDSVFWSRLVLQECHAEEAIRHAVVALGALYKTLDKTTESPPSSPAANIDPVDSAARHWEVAIKSYSNACNSLCTVTGQDSRANRTVLMANILLACFDSFIGDHQQAIKQIQNGLELLEKLRSQRRLAFMSKPEEPVEDEIIQMFTRLAIQAKSYDMAFHFPKPYVIELTRRPGDPSSPSSEGGSPVSLHQDPIPEESFSSLREARLAWDALCEKMFRFTEELFSRASRDSPMGVLPENLRRYGYGFHGQIEAWSYAFQPLLDSRFSPGMTSQEKAAIAVLKMFHIMGKILFQMTFSAEETQFDAFQPEFQAIVNLGMEVVGDEERRAAEKRCGDPRTCHHRDHVPDIFGGQTYRANHIKPSFSADLGIVPPLYVVATKCRSPIIRRQAIQLLKSSSRREAMWDSELVARIGNWIMEIEEGDVLVSPAESQAVFFPDASGPYIQAMDRSSTPPNSRRMDGFHDFGDNLGPGGNARWDARRKSTISLAVRSQQSVIPEERRIMVRSVEFDLKQRRAELKCGSRKLIAGQDSETRSTVISW